MNIKEFIKRRSENKFKKIEKFYNKFEVPSLEYTAYTKFKDKKWLVFIVFHLIDICFIIFWLWSLYYVATVLDRCMIESNLMLQYLNTSNLNTDMNFTEFLKNLTMVN